MKKNISQYSLFVEQDAEKRLEAFVERAKLTLTQKSVINPKPQKRFARVIEQDSLEEGPEPIPQSVPYDSPDKSLRPLRTAKDKANQNLVRQLCMIIFPLAYD